MQRNPIRKGAPFTSIRMVKQTENDAQPDRRRSVTGAQGLALVATLRTNSGGKLRTWPLESLEEETLQPAKLDIKQSVGLDQRLGPQDWNSEQAIEEDAFQGIRYNKKTVRKQRSSMKRASWS